MHFENKINDIVFNRIDRRANVNIRLFSRVFISGDKDKNSPQKWLHISSILSFIRFRRK
jgi:hypothetical protein